MAHYVCLRHKISINLPTIYPTICFRSFYHVLLKRKPEKPHISYLAHLSRRLTRWAYRMGGELATVRACVRVSICLSIHPCVNTFKNEYLCNQRADCNQILSEASMGCEKAALGFWPDRIWTVVSMATDSSHGVIMGKISLVLLRLHFWLDLLHTCR